MKYNACPCCGDIEVRKTNRDECIVVQCKSCSYILDKEPAQKEESPSKKK